MTPPPAQAEPATGVVRAAPAKLNLYLHVTGKRADGYHLLDSLVAFAGIHDTVIAREADGLTLGIEGPFAAGLTGDGDNLVLRAARTLGEHAGVSSGVRLTLIKRLPVASGIGGGSADAAAALRALDSLWGTRAGEDDLAALGLKLGADVPVCLFGRAGFVGGIGEHIVAAPVLPRAWLVLVNPGVPVATAQVFKARRGDFGAAGRFTESPKDAGALAQLLAARRNDLADPAMALCPAIAKVIGALTRAPGCLLARMSGSGATCFGIFDGEAAAVQAARGIAAVESGWWVAPSPLVTDTATLDPRL